MLKVLVIVLIIAAAAAIYLHFFVWPTMVDTVSKSNIATLREFSELLGGDDSAVTWWYRDRSLAAHVRGAKMSVMEVGAWRESMPDMAGALRGCDIISSTHLRWKDVDVRFYDISSGFVMLDDKKVYPAESMLPIEHHMPRNPRTMVNVMLPGEPRLHETLSAMYRTAVMTEKDGQMPTS